MQQHMHDRPSIRLSELMALVLISEETRTRSCYLLIMEVYIMNGIAAQHNIWPG